jgi:hypothetical protein
MFTLEMHVLKEASTHQPDIGLGWPSLLIRCPSESLSGGVYNHLHSSRNHENNFSKAKRPKKLESHHWVNKKKWENLQIWG